MPFIAFEGNEGSGKTSQFNRLKTVLDPVRTVFTREPGGTALGERLRSVLLDKEVRMAPETEMRIFLAARCELVETVIRPAIKAGKLVISDRFGLSTIAYQAYGRERRHLIRYLKNETKKILGDLEPPYCILFDIPPEIGLERVAERNDGLTRFDAETLEFHRRVRLGYLKHYNDNGRGFGINARLSIEEVASQIDAQMRKWNLV